MTAMKASVLTACALAVAAPAWTAETADGRWAADARACRDAQGPGPLVVTALSLRWRDAICVVRTSYLVRDIRHIGAQCWTDGATGNVPIKLRLRGQRLVLDWPGAPPEELRRCP